MRFKAKLATEQLQLLYNIITAISRVSSSNHASNESSGSTPNIMTHLTSGGSIIRLDPERMRIATRGNGEGGDGISAYVDLKTRSGVFLDHRLESAADNVIVFEIDLSQWKIAVQSILEGGLSGGVKARPMVFSTDNDRQEQKQDVVFTSSIIVMKLAKRNQLPCLCLDAYTSGGSVEVHHAIPIRVMRVEESQHYMSPPRIPFPDVQLEIPFQRPLRNVVERFKAISPHVYIEGTMKGELTLRIDGDGSSIRIFYNNLTPRFEECKKSTSKCTLKIDCKKLNSCLQWQAPNMKGFIASAVICMIPNEMLVLHITLNPGAIGYFTYYVPVHFLSPDPLE